MTRTATVAVALLLLVGCESSGSPAPARSSPSAASTAGGGRSTAAQAPTATPAACTSTTGERLSKQQAGACYLALATRVDDDVPIVVQTMRGDRNVTLTFIRSQTRAAVDAYTTSIAELRAVPWPQDVESLCARLAAFQARALEPLSRLATAGSVKEAQADFQQFQAQLRPRGPNPIGVEIRSRLGLPAPPTR